MKTEVAPPHARNLSADPSIERALQTGIVRSERTRVSLLLVVMALFLAIALLLVLVPGLAERELTERFRAAAPGVIGALVLMLAYQTVVRAWLGRLIREDREPLAAWRVGNIALEASFGTLLLGLTIHPAGAIQTLAGALPFVYFPLIILSALNLSFRLSALSGGVAAIGFLAVSLPALDAVEPIVGAAILTAPYQYVVKAVVLVICGLAAGFVGLELRRQLYLSLRTARDRDRAVSIFGQHVSPQIAERLLNQPRTLSAETRLVCVMFLDIRDFSRLAAQHSPERVVAYLNLLFDPLIQVVNDQRGIVNKFLGDGFMAVFGAPEADDQVCHRAAQCALELLANVAALNESGAIPPTRVGIGLHFGPAVTGNVGSESRKEYTVIGDTVNLAARIEQATKPLHAQLLISEAVWQRLEPGTFHGEDLGLVELKGQSKPAHVFKLA